MSRHKVKVFHKRGARASLNEIDKKTWTIPIKSSLREESFLRIRPSASIISIVIYPFSILIDCSSSLFTVLSTQQGSSFRSIIDRETFYLDQILLKVNKKKWLRKRKPFELGIGWFAIWRRRDGNCSTWWRCNVRKRWPTESRCCWDRGSQYTLRIYCNLMIKKLQIERKSNENLVSAAGAVVSQGAESDQVTASPSAPSFIDFIIIYKNNV